MRVSVPVYFISLVEDGPDGGVDAWLWFTATQHPSRFVTCHNLLGLSYSLGEMPIWCRTTLVLPQTVQVSRTFSNKIK